MSNPKEPNFFSDDEQYCKGMGWYSRLFELAPARDLLGEASTHYTKLPTYPQTIKRLHEHLPNARFIYIMRHPVDRLISHYMHEWSMGAYRCSIDRAVEQHNELIAYGQYAMQLEPYFEAYGRDVVLPVFFDRLVRDSQVELERICKFIGYKGESRWLEDQSPSNVSSERIRRFPFYSLLIDSDIATWLRRSLVPVSLRNTIKSRLTMQHRPVLSDENHAMLVDVFNQDLARIGEWLGVELNCSNFKSIITEKPLNWVDIDDK